MGEVPLYQCLSLERLPGLEADHLELPHERVARDCRLR